MNVKATQIKTGTLKTRATSQNNGNKTKWKKNKNEEKWGFTELEKIL